MFYGTSTSATSDDLYGTVSVPLCQPDGVYDLEVWDFGCSQWIELENSFEVYSDLFISSTNVSSLGACDGMATVLPTGGIPPYSYVWSVGGLAIATTPYLTGLCPGNYCVSVTDNSGCITNSCVNIITICSISAVISSAPPSSTGSCDGFAVFLPSSGTAPYTYQWTDYYGTLVSSSDLAPSLCHDMQTNQ